MILEAYNDRYYTTGVSFKTEVEPTGRRSSAIRSRMRSAAWT